MPHIENDYNEPSYILTNNGMRKMVTSYENKYGNNQLKFKDIYEAEKYFKKEYGCYDTYYGSRSTIYNGPLIEFHSTVKDTKYDCVSSENEYNIEYVHNKNSVNLIFPNEQIRISGSKSFMNKFPFVKALIEGDFNRDNFIKYSYLDDNYSENNEKEINGSTTIIVDNELESILLDKPSTIRQKKWETANYWKIEDVVIENLGELIHQYQNETYYNTKFTCNYT